MNRGDLVHTNLFGEDNSFGIILRVIKLPKDAIDFYKCSVLLPEGRIRNFVFSEILTINEIENGAEPLKFYK